MVSGINTQNGVFDTSNTEFVISGSGGATFGLFVAVIIVFLLAMCLCKYRQYWVGYVEPKYIMSEPAKQRRESGKYLGSEFSMDSDLRSSISSTKSRRRGVQFQPVEERYEIAEDVITDRTNRKTGEFVVRRESKPVAKNEEFKDLELTVKFYDE